MASEKQKRYLRRYYQEQDELTRGCDCPGCDKCAGFVKGCTCDHETEWLKVRYDREKGAQSNGQGMADRGTTQSLPGKAPDHVDPEAYQTFGF